VRLISILPHVSKFPKAFKSFYCEDEFFVMWCVGHKNFVMKIAQATDLKNLEKSSRRLR
jgi:hypothetical protein